MKALLTVLLLLTGCGDSETLEVAEKVDLKAKYSASIYRVHGYCDSYLASVGTAFKVDENTVATNRHVAEFECPFEAENTSLILKDEQGNTIADVVGTDFHPELDLAKLRVESPLPGLALNTATLSVAPTLNLSFPKGSSELAVNEGVSGKPLPECSGMACYDFTGTNQVQHGSSGSPLLDVNSGACVGIVAAGAAKSGTKYLKTFGINCSRLTEF